MCETASEEIAMFQKFANSVEIKGKSTNHKVDLWDGRLVKMEQCSECFEKFIGSVAFKIYSRMLIGWIMISS